MEKGFIYELGEEVELISGEKGKITGRADYLESVPQYFVTYVGGNGCLTETWLRAINIKSSALREIKVNLDVEVNIDVKRKGEEQN